MQEPVASPVYFTGQVAPAAARKPINKFFSLRMLCDRSHLSALSSSSSSSLQQPV